MRTLKFLFLSALLVFVGIPCVLVLFVMGMALFGVVFGVGMALIGIMLAVIKMALMIILPVALVVWLYRRATVRVHTSS